MATVGTAGRRLGDIVGDAPLPHGRVAVLARQLAAALADLHRLGLVHRGIKPETIRVAGDDSLTVVGLGLAWAPEVTAAAAAGSAIGAVAHVPPEAFIDGAAPDPSWDVWAFGLVVAQLAGGAHPYGYAMGDPADLVAAIREGEPDLSRVPWPWSRIAAACLHPIGRQRPTAAELPGLLDAADEVGDLAGDAAVLRALAARRKAKPVAAVFRSAAEADADAGNPSRARAWTEFIDDPRDRVPALLAVARGQMHAGDAVAARRTLDAAAHTAGSISRPRRRRWTLLEVARAQAEAGDIPAALLTADRIRPSREAWRRALVAVADAQAEAGDIPAAQQTAERIKLDMPIYGRLDWARALVAVVRAQAEAGDIPASLHTADRIRRYKHVWAAALVAVARIQAKTGAFPAAKQTLASAVDALARIYDEDGDRDRALVAVAVVQAEIGDTAAAQQTASDNFVGLARSQALLAVAVAQAQAGHTAPAMDTATRIKDRPQRIEALAQVARAQAATGDTATAQRTLETAAHTAGRRLSVKGRTTALAEVARAQAATGDTAAAQGTLAAAARNAGRVDDILVEVAKAQAAIGDTAGALRTVAGM